MKKYIALKEGKSIGVFNDTEEILAKLGIQLVDVTKDLITIAPKVVKAKPIVKSKPIGYNAGRNGKGRLDINGPIPKAPVFQYTLGGEFIGAYESQRVANLSLGRPTDHTGISSCVRGVSKSSAGFKWKYQHEPLPCNTSDPKTRLSKSKVKIPIYKCDLHGNAIAFFPDTKEAQVSLGKPNAKKILNALNRVNRKGKAYGFLWKKA
tara:strand:- start:573 stop:1193 length:621 start_codon:yes stop_codon:yes gene_type:complete